MHAHIAIALGTLFGGWRIVHTMGTRVTRLRPVGGFAAETGGAISVLLATRFGIPVSTTHTITGSIVGVGATTRARGVRWGIARRIVWAWVLTIPAAAAMSAAVYTFVRYVWLPLAAPGQVILGLIVAALLVYAFLVWIRSVRREKVAHA